MADLTDLLRTLHEDGPDRPPVEELRTRNAGRRRRRWRAGGVGALAIALMAGIGIAARPEGEEAQQVEVGGDPDAPATVPPGAIRDGTVGFDGARVVGERELLLSYTGGNPLLAPGDPCWTGVLPRVDIEAERMIVRLERYRADPTGTTGPATACTQEGYARTVPVDLPEPRGDRPLVDARDDEEAHVFTDDLLEPTQLPRGLERVAERVAFGWDQPAWEIGYNRREPPQDLRPQYTLGLGVYLVQGPASIVDDRQAAGTVLDRYAVRDQPAELVQQAPGLLLRWTEGDRGFVLREEGLTRVQLLGAAGSLPPPDAPAPTETRRSSPDSTVPPDARYLGDGYVQIGRVTDDPRKLLVAYTEASPTLTPADGCWRGAVATAQVEPTRVLVTLEEYGPARSVTDAAPPGSECEQGGAYFQMVPVLLSEPFDGRPVVDAGTGDDVRLFTDQLLAPTRLPRGFEGFELAFSFGDDEFGWTLAHGRLLPPEEDGDLRAVPDLSLSVMQGSAALLPSQPTTGPVIDRPRVRGVVAELVQEPFDSFVLRWVEGERGFVLRSQGLTAEELLAAARSLAPAD